MFLYSPRSQGSQVSLPLVLPGRQTETTEASELIHTFNIICWGVGDSAPPRMIQLLRLIEECLQKYHMTNVVNTLMHWRIYIQSLPAHVPLWDPILSFSHTLEVHAPYGPLPLWETLNLPLLWVVCSKNLYHHLKVG